MTIYWSPLPQTSQRWRIISTLGLAIVLLVLFLWSPLWVVPTPLGIATMLLVYMLLSFGVLVWALRRIPLKTRRDALPLVPLLVVMLYLGMVALAVLPLLTVIGSYDVQCQQSDTQHICRGYVLKTDEQWQLEGRRVGDSPFIWVTTRHFER